MTLHMGLHLFHITVQQPRHSYSMGHDLQPRIEWPVHLIPFYSFRPGTGFRQFSKLELMQVAGSQDTCNYLMPSNAQRQQEQAQQSQSNPVFRSS